jgi:hypothetical protein
MSDTSKEGHALALPPQTQGIPRVAGGRGALDSNSVHASAKCGDLPGLARSLCYASKGVKY